MSRDDDRHTRPTLPPSAPRRPEVPGIRGTALPEREPATLRPVEPERRKLSPPGGTPTGRQDTSPPSSSLSPEAKVERAAGVILVAVARRLGWGGALGLVGILFGGGTALKQLGAPGDVDKAIAAERERLRLRDVEWRKWFREWHQYQECRRRNVNDTLEALTPDLDKMGSSKPLKPWFDRCKDLPAPEPPKDP